MRKSIQELTNKLKGVFQKTRRLSVKKDDILWLLLTFVFLVFEG